MRERERESERERERERILKDDSARERHTDKYSYYIPRVCLDFMYPSRGRRQLVSDHRVYVSMRESNCEREWA